MAIQDDFSIDRVTGNIRYTGTTANYTVLQFYEWLRDLGDDPVAAGNDLYDITDPDIASKAFDTIINLLGTTNIDATVAQHLYGGSIIQVDGTIYDGIVVYSPQNTYLQIIQNGALATNFWATGINADAANGISHQFMLRVSNAGAEIDGRRFVATTREWGNSYAEFVVNGTSRGNNTVALSTTNDLNNTTVVGTIAALADIANTEGFRSINIGGTAYNFYSEWDKGANTINVFYERMKWLTRRGTTSTIYGLDGDIFRGITHEINVDTPTGTFAAVEAVSWAGGTGQMLAINSTTAATKMWIQLLTGVQPTDEQVITGGTSAATCAVNVTVTSRDISTPWCGQSTGSALIGAFGFGIEAADLSSSDRVFDLTNAQRTPPNNVQFTITNLIPGDRVLVGPKDVGDAIDYNQLSLSGSLTSAAATSIVVSTAIPSGTPATGTIRVQNDAGNYIRCVYTIYTGSTFTINSTDFSVTNATTGNNVFISYIDIGTTGASEAFTGVYASDRDLWVRVRNSAVPIKTFETAATFGNANVSVSTIRTSDA
jgi:hypothetical protein